MTLEEMIYDRISNDAEIPRMLTTYGNKPAVFYQSAAKESDKRWGDAQFPRIDFVVDMQEDPSANSVGVLAVNIYSDTRDEGVEPEDIERRIRAILHATIAKPDDSPAFCFVWVRSDSFEYQPEKSPYILGYTLIFSVVALPKQNTTTPDPVAAINRYTKALLPSAKVIGLDDVSGWLAPTREAPAIYWQLASLRPTKATNSVVWVIGGITGHVFAPTSDDRMASVWQIVQALLTGNHVPMEDGSPMFADDVQSNPQASYLSAGQIVIGARYGILYPDMTAPQKLLKHNIPREMFSSAISMAAIADPQGYRIMYDVAGTTRSGQLPAT